MKLYLTLNSLGENFDIFEILANYQHAYRIELGQTYDIKTTNRTSSVDFINDFNKKAKELGYKTTVHIGGHLAKIVGTEIGNFDLKPLLQYASRVQFNRYTVNKHICLSNVQTANPDTRLILPACKIYQKIDYFPTDQDVDWLYDCSHGQGLLIDNFPKCQLSNRTNFLGYAGGINSNTIQYVSDRLIDLYGNSSKTLYLDLESGIRTDDNVDYDKIRNLLTIFAQIQTKLMQLQ